MKVTRETFNDVMMPCYAPGNMIPVKGKGSEVWDQEGKAYIDLTGGIAVNVLGHSHDELVKALLDQAQNLWHLSNVMTNEPALRLAKKLTELTFAERVFLCNSGAEANEAAFKLARRYQHDKGNTHKKTLLAFNRSFHGRTLFTVSVGGQPAYTEGFDPIPGGIVHAEFNNLDSVMEKIDDTLCAIVVEPIQGEGGVKPADKAFLEGLRELADKNDALLIFDEVQTGVGRTGHLYAYQAYGVTPDILTTAKALGGGFPIGAMLATDQVGKSLIPGTHGSTYGGNPLGCAVAEKLLELVANADLLAGVGDKAAIIKEALSKFNDQHSIFSNIRGEGLLIGAELAEPFIGKASDIIRQARENGVFVLVAGSNVIRFAPALNIEQEVLQEGMARFFRTLTDLLNSNKNTLTD